MTNLRASQMSNTELAAAIRDTFSYLSADYTQATPWLHTIFTSHLNELLAVQASRARWMDLPGDANNLIVGAGLVGDGRSNQKGSADESKQT